MAGSPATLPGFDYSTLAPDVRATVETATRRLHELERRTSESIIEIGRHLIAVKSEIGHGHFLPWIDAEFGWSDRTARNFMYVAEEFGDKSETVSNLSAKVLYALAAPSTPVDIQEAFTRLAELRQPVTHKDVREAIAERKAPRRAEPIPVDEWDDDEPEEVPYEVVDMRTGELSPPMSRSHSTSFMPPQAPPSYPTTEQEANRIAADLRARHGAGLAIQIADAIYAQCGANRGAA